MKQFAQKIDPITLEIYWDRLISIMNEADEVLLRSALSMIIAESKDFSLLLLDENGISLAQSTTSLSVFTGILPYTLQELLKSFPAERLQDGDVLLTNDPWIGAGHSHDFCFASPIFHKGRLIAYITALTHTVDHGGSLSYFGTKDVFEEGLLIPPCKLYCAGKPNKLVFDIICANSRMPDEIFGDLKAINSVMHIAIEKIREFLIDYDLEDLKAISDNIMDLSDKVMRRAIAEVPRGTYNNTIITDGYAGSGPIKIVVSITIDEGYLQVNYAGSSQQTRMAAINCNLNYTRGSTYVALKSIFVPDIPNNSGLFRNVRIMAPEGCILNCTSPVAVNGRSTVAIQIHNAIFGALASVIPDKVQAGSGSYWGIIISGQYSNGRFFSGAMLVNGGMGASSSKDGLSAIAYPWNSIITPTEILESRVPLLLDRKELLPNSGGDGLYRGGMGQRLDFRTRGKIPIHIEVRPVHIKFPPFGLLGGKAGSTGRILLNGKLSNKKTSFTLHEGDVLTCELPGGGGFYTKR